MKFLMTAAALATLAATPAFAAKHNYNQPSVSNEGANAYAYQMRDPDAVVVGGQIVGRDPDPSIRFQMLRDHGLLAD